MTALQTQLDERGQERQPISGVRLRELAQQEALERLIGLLDAREQESPHAPMPAYRWHDSLHRRARLRAARATYALDTTGDMVRMGPGAWILRRHA